MNNNFGYNKDILDLIKQPKSATPKPEPTKPVNSVKIVEENDEQIPLSESRIVVKLSGIQVNENGQLSKTRYFDMLAIDEDQYKDIQFTPDQAKKVSMAMKAMSTGLTASIPLICTGPDCPFKATCPYMLANQPPIGRSCLVEKQLINYWTQQYVEEFQVNFNSPTELRMVAELAEFDIYELRITKYLAEKHPTLLQDVISVDKQGNEIANLEISKAFDLKEKIKRNRMKVLEALMATRKDKVKIMSEVVSGNSTANKLDELKKKIDSLNKEIGKMDYIDAEVVRESK